MKTCRTHDHRLYHDRNSLMVLQDAISSVIASRRRGNPGVLMSRVRVAERIYGSPRRFAPRDDDGVNHP